MGMFHACEFPVFYEGTGIVPKKLVIRDDVFEDIIHDLVPDGTLFRVEDWNDDFRDVVLQKRGCVWVVTDRIDGPDALPDSYYHAAKALRHNQERALRSHPYL